MSRRRVFRVSEARSRGPEGFVVLNSCYRPDRGDAASGRNPANPNGEDCYLDENPQDLRRLQDLLDASVERAGSFLRSSFEMPERSLSAAGLVGALDGPLTVALATTTARGNPGWPP